MAVKINKTIKGTRKNDTLVNKNTSGYTLMQGGAGNDTYIINTISKTFTDINDTKGTDNVQIKGANGNDLLFFFDVVVDESYGNVGDELFVIDKKNMNTALKQMQKFLANPNASKNIPQSGAVCIDYYFGNTNNIQENGKLGTNYGNNHIEKIYAVNSTGAKYLYDLKPYFKTARERILTFLQNNGYNAASDVLLSNNETHKKALINIYKNTPINYTVTGSAKNDKLTGGSGNDLIKGNNGNDNINGANGNDKLYGGAGNDNINGSNGNDKLYGEAGNDVLNGGAGNDQLTGGKGKDKLYTGAGNDTVYFNKGDGADTLYKGSGADTLRFNNFANISKLKSGLKMSKSGNNLVIKYTSKDSVTLYNYFKSGVGTSVATLMAKDGKTINFSDFYGSYIFKTYTGTKNKTNKITGSALNDLIKGNNKNDTLNGGSGNDKIYGYAGNDSIHGNAGNDYIDGGDGNDQLYGDAGTNTIKGGAGNDSIYGGTGIDRIYAGTGNDYINGGKGANTLYFGKNEGSNTVVNGGGSDTIFFNAETRLGNVQASYSGNNLILKSTGTTVTIKDYKKGGHSAKYIQVGGTKKSMAEFLKSAIPDPIAPTDPYVIANITKGTDGNDVLVQTYGENNSSAYENQLNILKNEYGATQEWIEKYTNDLSSKARDVSNKYSNVQGVLSDISWYEYLISNYDNPNYTGDTYFKYWSKEYYIDQLAQANADAYGLTYSWETYRDAQLENGATLEDLNYSIEYARYQNTLDKYNKYQGYAQDTSTIPTFRDIAIAHGYTSENGDEYWENKANGIMRTLNGFKGSRQIYEELLDTYAESNPDFATLKANYDNNNEEYEEAYNSAIEAILADENNAGIKAAYDTWQADLAKYNKYSEYSQNYYNAEYLGKDYNCDVEGKDYVSFRQEAEAERENKVIHDYYQKQYRYRTGQEYWSYKAELMNREINGYEGTISRYNYFYMLSRDGNPLSIYYDLYREVRDEYNDYADEYNTYASYVNNWDNLSYIGETGDDALTIDPDVWSGRANIVNVALSGRISEYNAAADELNRLVQYIKDNAPSETALQILTHLTTSGYGGIIIAGDGDDDITIGHIEPNTDNVSRGEVFAMGQGGNDTYRIENYGTEGAYGENIGITIYDHEGTNTVHLNSIELNSGNIGVYANVTLVKNPDGSYATNPDGSYQYTLENFKTYLGLSSGSWSCMERSPLKNGDAGYSLLLVDAQTYSNRYAFSYGAMDQAGIKLDTQTVEHIDKIYSNDGKYITQDQLREMFQKTANKLAQMGYDSFMEAVEENINSGIYEKQHNLAMLTSSEVQGSLEWVTDETVNTEGATEGLVGTDRNDNLTSTSANETFDLKLGNDTVTFEGEFGNDIIQSSSTVDNQGNARQADTLNLQDYSIEDRTLVLERNGNDLVLKAYAEDKTTVKGTVTYKDFLNGETYNSRKFVLNAKDNTYMVWFNEAQERTNQEDVVAMDIDDQGNNFCNIRFIKSLDNGLVRISTNENRSSYIVLDNTPILLFKSTNTGTKEVISYGNADDQYREALSETTDLIINDNGGNDSLEITGGYYEIIGDAHMRYFFDVTDEGVVSDAKHIIWTDNFYTPNKEEYEDGRSQIVGYSYATENLIKLLNNDHEHMKGAITIYGDIEEIENDNHPSLAYNYKMSYNKVVESTLIDVVPWLNDESNYYDAENDTWSVGHHYTSVTDALTKLQAGIDAKQAEIEKIDLSGIQYDEDRNAIPETIPEEYTQLKTEQDAIQAKINELLGFYNKGYEDVINTNVIGTSGEDNISIDSGLTKYIEVKEGDDTVDLLYTSHGNHVEYYYDFERGDGHDTFIYSNKYDSICINKGSSEMYTKFCTDGWDLKIEFYSNADATENPQGSILLKDYFYNLSNHRIDTLIIKSDNADDVEYSIDNLLREPNAVLNNDVNVAFGTAGNDTFEGTNGNDIYYIGAGDDTITCSTGNDTYYLSNVYQHYGDSTFKYTIGNGDDVIYGGSYLTRLTLNYDDNDISMEFRENGDDLRMVFFDYDGVDRGSITIKDYKNTARQCLNHPDDWVKTFYIKKNESDAGTSYKLADLIKQYTDMGGSLAENNDSTYINIIRITPETANGLQLTNSGKVDRLIFDNTYNTVTGNLSGNDLVLTYGDTKTLVVKDYVTGASSIYDVKVNGEFTTLGDLSGLYYGTTGDDTFIHSAEDNVVRTYNLNTGNDTVEFPVTPVRYDAYPDGTKLYNNAVINSQGGLENTDTIKIEDYSLANNNQDNGANTKLNFGFTDDENGITIKGERDFNPSSLVNYHKYTNITYNNFMSDSSPNLRIQMSYGDYDKSYYNVHKYNTAQNLDTQNSFEYAERTANILFIKDTNTSHTSNITSSSYSNAQIVTTGGAALNFTGHDGDIIVTNSTVSNDTYHIYSADNMKLHITDKGGNDTLNLENLRIYGNTNEVENLYLSFNVNADGTTGDRFAISYGIGQGTLYNKLKSLQTNEKDLVAGTVVIDAAKQDGKNVGIEHVNVYSSDWNEGYVDENRFLHAKTTLIGEIDIESWYSAVKQDVQAWMTTNAGWMTENNLNSTADVFGIDTSKYTELVNIYESHNASMYIS